jgi:hypothetical protein
MNTTTKLCRSESRSLMPATDDRGGLRLRGRISRRLAIVPLAVTLALPLFPDTASADTVWGWGNPVISVNTGAKNYGNRTQYVSSITITDPGNRCDGGTAEAWVSRPGVINWYASRQMCGSTMFWIQRWVPSGSSVCGSNWFKGRYANGAEGWFRGISCITIRV